MAGEGQGHMWVGPSFQWQHEFTFGKTNHKSTQEKS